MLTIEINGVEYELATTLRVAYLVQAQHNHANYIDVFSRIDKMSIEEQIGILWAAFSAKNPESTKRVDRKMFTNIVLDTFDLSMLMELIKKIIEGIMGKELTDQAEKTEAEAENTEESDEDFLMEPGMESFEEELVQD